MNKKECDLLNNEPVDCFDCTDRKECDNARGNGRLFLAIIIVGLFGALFFLYATILNPRWL